MNEKILLSVGATFDKTIKDTLKKQLKALEKELKLTISNVDLAGKQIRQNETDTKKTQTQRVVNIEKAHAQALAMEKKFNEKIGAQREKAEIKRREDEKKWNLKQTQEMNKTQDERYNNRQKELKDIEKYHAKAIEMNKKFDAQRIKQAESTRSKLSRINSGGSSSIKIFDDIDRESTQSSFTNKMSSAQSRLGTISKSGVFNKEQIAGVNSELDGLKLRIDKISNNKMAKQWETDFGKVNAKLSGMRVEVDKTAYSFGNMMKNGIRSMVVWSATATLLYAPLRAFQDGLKTLKEIDTQLVDIAKVTNLTKQEMKDLALYASDMGVKYGRTAQEYLSSVTEFSRAGYGNKAKSLGEVTMLLQNVGDVNDEVANSFLLATDAAYKFNGSQEKLTNVVNGLNNVSNQNATSVSKIAEGMSVSATTSKQAGVDISQLTGAIATMTTVTQRSGSEAGRAFKGILMNLRMIKGETEDGEIIDAESLSKSEKALSAAGIAIREMKNGVEELRDPMKILEEMSQKWKTMGEMKQAGIVEAVGGKYRGEQLSALMERWDIYTKTVNEYINNNNSAILENQIYMDSWEAKSKQLSASMSKFWQESLNTDMIKGFIDSLRGVVEWLTKAGGLLPILIGLLAGGLTAAIVAVKLGVTVLNVELSYTNLLLGGLPLIIGLITTALSGWIISTNKSKQAGDEFNKTLEVQTRNYEELKKAQEDSTKQANDWKNAQLGEVKLAEMLTGQLQTLSEKTNKTTFEKAQMFQITEKLNKIIPDLNLNVNKETGELNKQIGVVQSAINAYRELLLVKASEKVAGDAAGRLYESQINIDRAKAQREKLIKEAVPMAESMRKGLLTGQVPKDVDFNRYNAIQDTVKTLNNTINDNLHIAYQADTDIKKSFELSEAYAKKFPQKVIESSTSGTPFVVDTGDKKSKGLGSDAPDTNIEKYTLDLKEETYKWQQIVDDSTNALELNRAEQEKGNLTTTQTTALLRQEIELMKQKRKSLNDLTAEEGEVAKRTRAKIENQGYFDAKGKWNGITFDAKGNMDLDSYDATMKSKSSEFDALGTEMGRTKRDSERYKQIVQRREDLKFDLDNLKKWSDEYIAIRAKHNQHLIDLTKELGDIYKKEADITKNAKEKRQKDAQEKLDAIESTEKLIQEIIKKGVDKQKDLYDEDLENYKKATDDIIDELGRRWEAEDYNKDLSDQTKKRQLLQNEINVLSLDKSFGGQQKVRELKTKLADMDVKIADDQEKRKRVLVKQSLEDSLKAKEEDIDNKKKLLDKEFSDEKIRVLAHESLVNGSFDNLTAKIPGFFNNLAINTSKGFLKILDQYNKAYGDRFKNIVQTARMAAEEVSNLNLLQTQANPQKTLSPAEKAKEDIGKLQDQWWQIDAMEKDGVATASDSEKKKTLNKSANNLRALYSIDKTTDFRGYVGSYSDGGVNTQTGWAMLHGTPTKPEFILNYDQMKNFLSNAIAKNSSYTPMKTAMGGINLAINVSGNADASTITGIKNAGTQIITQMKKLINKNGVSR